MAAANGDAKLTAASSEVLGEFVDTSNLKVTMIAVQVLGRFDENVPLRLTTVQVQVIGGMVKKEAVSFNAGSNLGFMLTVHKFESVSIDGGSQFEGPTSRPDLSVSIGCRSLAEFQITNWVRSEPYLKDDWTPEEPII